MINLEKRATQLAVEYIKAKETNDLSNMIDIPLVAAKERVLGAFSSYVLELKKEDSVSQFVKLYGMQGITMLQSPGCKLFRKCQETLIRAEYLIDTSEGIKRSVSGDELYTKLYNKLINN